MVYCMLIFDTYKYSVQNNKYNSHTAYSLISYRITTTINAIN